MRVTKPEVEWENIETEGIWNVLLTQMNGVSLEIMLAVVSVPR
jgi:hypothetical protein